MNRIDPHPTSSGDDGDSELRGQVMHVLGYCTYTDANYTCEHKPTGDLSEMREVDGIMALIQARDKRLTERAGVEARLVELDLLEQALNRYTSMKRMNEYKLQRLADLEAQLVKIDERNNDANSNR